MHIIFNGSDGWTIKDLVHGEMKANTIKELHAAIDHLYGLETLNGVCKDMRNKECPVCRKIRDRK